MPPRRAATIAGKRPWGVCGSLIVGPARCTNMAGMALPIAPIAIAGTMASSMIAELTE